MHMPAARLPGAHAQVVQRMAAGGALRMRGDCALGAVRMHCRCCAHACVVLCAYVHVMAWLALCACVGRVARLCLERVHAQ